jgi:hypothetical protein
MTYNGVQSGLQTLAIPLLFALLSGSEGGKVDFDQGSGNVLTTSDLASDQRLLRSELVLARFGLLAVETQVLWYEGLLQLLRMELERIVVAVGMRAVVQEGQTARARARSRVRSATVFVGVHTDDGGERHHQQA